MRKLSMFNFITLNGCYKGANGDISWHRHGGEESEYSEDALKADNILLFGRITYQMMAGYWTTPMAMQNTPVVAEGMNRAEKIVFSKTMEKAEWQNTRLIKDHLVEEVREMKKQPGKNMTILGSGTIATLFAEHGLIDEYQVMVDPVAIGNGTPIFRNLKKPLDLKLTGSRVFKSGVVLLDYIPMTI